MLVGLAVLEAPHVEPRRRVALRSILRILDLAHVRDDDEIALRHHRYDFGARLLRDRLGLDLQHFGEELHDAGAARGGIRVVLEIGLRQVLVRELPVARLQQVLHDVVRGLLVPVERGVAAVKERLGVLGRDDGFLRVEPGAAGQDRRGQHQLQNVTHAFLL